MPWQPTSETRQQQSPAFSHVEEGEQEGQREMTEKESRSKIKNSKKGRCMVRYIEKSCQTVMGMCGKEKKTGEQRNRERGEGGGRYMKR